MKTARILAFVVGISLAAGASAQEQTKGPETNLPLPRFVSLKKERANIRRGPGLTYRIDWVFLHKGMPLEITAEHGHWRRVRDMDDAGGWVHHALLRGARTAVVITEEAALRDSPALNAQLVALAQTSAVLSLRACVKDWCEVEGDNLRGWARKADLWGVRSDENFD